MLELLKVHKVKAGLRLPSLAFHSVTNINSRLLYGYRGTGEERLRHRYCPRQASGGRQQVCRSTAATRCESSRAVRWLRSRLCLRRAALDRLPTFPHFAVSDVGEANCNAAGASVKKCSLHSEAWRGATIAPPCPEPFLGSSRSRSGLATNTQTHTAKQRLQQSSLCHRRVQRGFRIQCIG